MIVNAYIVMSTSVLLSNLRNKRLGVKLKTQGAIIIKLGNTIMEIKLKILDFIVSTPI